MLRLLLAVSFVAPRVLHLLKWVHLVVATKLQSGTFVSGHPLVET